MNFNSQAALITLFVCLIAILFGLVIQALGQYLNKPELVRNKILASLFIAIIIGFIVKGK